MKTYYVPLLVFAVSLATQLVMSGADVFGMSLATWETFVNAAIMAVLAWFIAWATPKTVRALKKD